MHNNYTNTDESTLVTQCLEQTSIDEQPYYSATIVFHPNLDYVGASKPLTSNHSIALSRHCNGFINQHYPEGISLDNIYISRKPLTLTLKGHNLNIELHPGSTPVIINNTPIEAGRTYQFDLEKQELLIEMNRWVFIYIHKKRVHKNTLQELNMLGISDEIQEVRNHILQVADTDIPVLIRGESGVGKELVAFALHHASQRSQHPYVPVNVGAIAESLIPAELFGVSKGSFTGATSNKNGFFQQANNGTLFLDEIGDAREDLQVALLRVLEDNEIRPIGASKYFKVNTRLITATDACLEEKLRDKTFRNPLLQRLSGFEIWIPPLRARKVDIGLLITYFLKDFCHKYNCKDLLSSTNNAVINFLSHLYSLAINFSWPGNIRQLRNIVQQVVIHNRNSKNPRLPKQLHSLFYPEQKAEKTQLATVNIDDIPTERTNDTQPEVDKPNERIKRKPRDITEEELLEAHSRSRYEIQQTAKILGISRGSIYIMADLNPKIIKASDLSVEQIITAFYQCKKDLDAMVEQLKISKAALKRRLNEAAIKHRIEEIDNEE